jgi:hypothetical protein
MSNHIFRKFLGFIFFLLITFSISSCNIPVPIPIPAFVSGIRIRATEEVAVLPGSRFPSANAAYAGYLTLTIGPGSGSETAISGRTNANGLGDHPNARSNAYWTVTLNSRNPSCEFDPTVRPVYTKAEFWFKCVL